MLSIQIEKEHEDFIKKVISEGRFVALLLDETTDCTNIAQLVVHLRIVYRGELRTFFYKMIELTGSQTSEALVRVVVNFLSGKIIASPSFNSRVFCRKRYSCRTNTYRK